MKTKTAKKISLKELNANGNLVLTFKKNCYIVNEHVYHYANHNPTYCYLHYYKEEFIITMHIIETEQFKYNNWEEAQEAFNIFIEDTNI